MGFKSAGIYGEENTTNYGEDFLQKNIITDYVFTLKT